MAEKYFSKVTVTKAPGKEPKGFNKQKYTIGFGTNSDTPAYWITVVTTTTLIGIEKSKIDIAADSRREQDHAFFDNDTYMALFEKMKIAMTDIAGGIHKKVIIDFEGNISEQGKILTDTKVA